MPKAGTAEYAELESNPDAAFLKTITAQLQTLLSVSLIEILSRHSTDEVYLGQNDSPEWTSDAETLACSILTHQTIVERVDSLEKEFPTVSQSEPFDMYCNGSIQKKMQTCRD
ncbi:hypothetical protein ACFX2J_023705 [Malus domestica]|uniref:Lipoxygenase domain-containing protein n=1 Tax=Malus domestica TaxID=3750 RepID=A0A498HGD5_MALDO|nr:hypothetical protein DVH24_028348 [Malus domestica]